MFGQRLALLALLIAFPGCGTSAPVGEVDRVTEVAEDDPKMLAAIDEARRTADQFINILDSPDPGRTMVSLKVPFKDGESVEHMWLADVTYKDGKFTGFVANDPQLVHNITIGESVTVPREEISDWMYVEQGKLFGGHSMRVLLDTMSPQEREEFRRSAPFQLD